MFPFSTFVLQIVENGDFQKEYDAMTVHRYDSFNGPLWCAKLLPLSPDTPCAMPEIKETFPHQYQFLFGFNHCITDGPSNIAISSLFVDILNDVISGKCINDLEQLGEHVSDEQTMKLFEEAFQELMKNPREAETYKSILDGSMTDALFLKAYPPPTNKTPKTLNLTCSLSKEETKRFIERCKKEGVTIHSGFCSVANAAIVDMLAKTGIKQESYKIKNYHTVNIRRYWKGETSKTLGAHFGKLTLLSEITSDINKFWNEARTFHQAFTKLLEDKGPIKESAVSFMNLPSDLDINDFIKNFPRGDTCYGTTNMGNLATTLKGEGDHVQVTDFRRTTSTANNLCSHVLQTFRGRFVYGLDYDASLMAEETAHLYVETIFRILRTVTKI